MKIVTLLLAGSAVVSALPSSLTKPKQCQSTPELANFDDLKGIPGLELLNSIPTPYNGLYFQGFYFLPVIKTGLLAGVVPHSNNTYAYSNALTQAAQGSAEWTIQYPSSTVKSVSLESFWYGCSIDLQNGATASPTSCNIAVTAFKQGDNTAQAVEVGSQTFTYNPTSSIGVQQQAFGEFNSFFKDIQYVLIQYTVADQTKSALQADLVLLVDDVKYSLCQ